MKILNPMGVILKTSDDDNECGDGDSDGSGGN